jgi:hypothetical protein
VTDILRDMVSDALPRRPRPMPRWKIEFYRQSRLWHGYLSAFAFISLMFFSVTGLLLNHPEWLKSEEAKPQEIRLMLLPGDIAAAQKAADPARAVAALIDAKGAVGGIYASGEIEGDEAYLRYEGVTGNTSLVVDLKTGQADATVQKPGAVTILNDLHRGKNVGEAWKLFIDISAVLFLVLSLVGYILFFSLRYRLVQTLTLTGVSLLAMVGLFVWLAP